MRRHCKSNSNTNKHNIIHKANLITMNSFSTSWCVSDVINHRLKIHNNNICAEKYDLFFWSSDNILTYHILKLNNSCTIHSNWFQFTECNTIQIILIHLKLFRSTIQTLLSLCIVFFKLQNSKTKIGNWILLYFYSVFFEDKKKEFFEKKIVREFFTFLINLTFKLAAVQALTFRYQHSLP